MSVDAATEASVKEDSMFWCPRVDVCGGKGTWRRNPKSGNNAVGKTRQTGCFLLCDRNRELETSCAHCVTDGKPPSIFSTDSNGNANRTSIVDIGVGVGVGNNTAARLPEMFNNDS